MKLIVLRHGKASHNFGSEKEHTFAGSKIDDELIERGIENAEFLAGKIKSCGGADVIIDSFLKRSKQTAKIIQSKLDRVPIFTINELAEINIGDFAGHTEEEVRKLYPEAAKDFYDGNVEKWQFPNGENFNDVSERLDIALEKIRNLTPNKKKIVISGHSMINRVLFYKLIPGQKNLWKERFYPHDRIVEIELKKEEN